MAPDTEKPVPMAGARWWVLPLPDEDGRYHVLVRDPWGTKGAHAAVRPDCDGSAQLRAALAAAIRDARAAMRVIMRARH